MQVSNRGVSGRVGPVTVSNRHVGAGVGPVGVTHTFGDRTASRTRRRTAPRTTPRLTKAETDYIDSLIARIDTETDQAMTARAGWAAALQEGN